jgi:hypothetical protein
MDQNCHSCERYLFTNRPEGDEDCVIGQCGCVLCYTCYRRLNSYPADHKFLPEELDGELQKCLCNTEDRPEKELYVVYVDNKITMIIDRLDTLRLLKPSIQTRAIATAFSAHNVRRRKEIMDELAGMK